MCELVLPKVTVILRGYETKQVLTVVEQLVGTKVNSIEVASNSPHAMESIAAARKEFGAEVHVGAGTVKNAELARQAIAAGAEFMLSPIMFTQEIFDLAKEAGVITVPAAFSPTEIQKMIDMGADIVKVFPAGQLGPDYLKAVQAPLGKLPLMVVGGVNVANVQSYFDKGATYAGIGSGIFDPADIEACDAPKLAASIKKLEESVVW
ncbi:MAG TPA: bifunctional 4-hydroxy-2-oxoglutarate aldolase/2-dehydro-3-deoxy-phosphogluconate aldolase [Candidatus Olsenella avicola]|uniref:bifunctional 4-hydroxy-2-oxoglutarate aldolase/2-dehydro-3-deoxy-phosphogluconate aldolase n=1 Tax=Olsenella sp. An290 TaxID=1965625 RepID=UPI000B3A3FC9|nr:bifunctional 4-hydroxy-2-oxoglutarate aldolase/2-dehydro-3-deoxy-phosphogluconate aldolase [Olsenella sp. An290]OUO33983.1 2-dehydro-3-deoxyphosphogluconate aldolase [Olsenella sp. An290]HIY52008.1 bifunctional 4-hydroxy-2-oxoglutarate aldolase/2-dehydro-3-deoxy-phosphogluconate aldolase [Candidatus Olsenella avicola]